jgi:hypothetical protein
MRIRAACRWLRPLAAGHARRRKRNVSKKSVLLKKIKREENVFINGAAVLSKTILFSQTPDNGPFFE